MSMIHSEISFKTTSPSYRFKVSMESQLILNLDTSPPTVTQPNITSVCFKTQGQKKHPDIYLFPQIVMRRSMTSATNTNSASKSGTKLTCDQRHL